MNSGRWRMWDIEKAEFSGNPSKADARFLYSTRRLNSQLFSYRTTAIWLPVERDVTYQAARISLRKRDIVSFSSVA
jgi:diaminopimelate epimerase